MVPLFTGLALEDAAAIVERLQEGNVPYRIGERGDSILVPASRLHEVRMMVAATGLPTGGVVGLESLDGASWASTDVERQARLVQALQGELTRTILQIRGVNAARVHIVLPRESIFAGQSRPSAAAVMVEMRPGHSLSRDQVQAVVHLVTGAVPDLAPERVTVLDARGQLLSAGADPEAGPGLLQNRTELRQSMESQLSGQVQSMLEQVMGPGNALVTVRVELDFDQRETEQVLLQPAAEPLIRSRQEIRETFEGTGSPPGGLPGTASNLPGASIPVYAMGGTAGGDSEWERTQIVVNYEFSETREKVVEAPGQVSRLSASVVLNRQLTPEEEAAVARLAGAALGLDPTRGDELVVVGMPFDTSLADQLREGLGEPARAPFAWWPFAAGGALLLMLAVALATRLRTRRRRRPSLALVAGEQLTPAVAPQAAVPAAAAAGKASLAELAELARHKPETVARLLRTWISDN
jgi:flagellar M-ring protein FliF